MRKTIYIHIGAHKTGTTSVQHYFSTIREALKLRGLLYPMSCRYHFAQHRLAFATIGRRDGVRNDYPDLGAESEELLHEIEASEAGTIFISSEVFFSAPRSAIAALRHALDRHNLHIIAVIRRPDDMFESTYNQKVKSTSNRFTKSYSDFLDDPFRLTQDLDFATCLGNWIAEFGRSSVTIGCHEEYPDIIDFVAEVVGLDTKGLPPRPKRANPSLSVKSAELIRLGKVAKLDTALLRRIAGIAGEILGPDSKSEALLTPRDRRRLLRRLEPMTKKLFRDILDRPNLYALNLLKQADLPPATFLSPVEAIDVMARLAGHPGPENKLVEPDEDSSDGDDVDVEDERPKT